MLCPLVRGFAADARLAQAEWEERIVFETAARQTDAQCWTAAFVDDCSAHVACCSSRQDPGAAFGERVRLI